MFTFYDVVEIQDSCKLNVLEKYLLIRTVEELLNEEPDFKKVRESLQELFNRIPKKSTTLTMIPKEEIKNEEILTNLNMFEKLTSYSRNPLEPLFIMLIKDQKNKKDIAEIITEICRGQIIKAFKIVITIQHKED